MKTPTIPEAIYRLIIEENLPRLSAAEEVPFATLKSREEDFFVEESLAFEPSGAGNFLYAVIEKRGIDARRLIREVAQTLEIPPAEVGSAGMKDKDAVTRQTLSLPGRVEPILQRISALEGIRVVSIARHHHHLKTGKLRGNSFSILLRGEDFTTQRVEATAEKIREEGVANFYGSQRFGRRGQTVAEGWRMVRGELRSLPRSKGMRRLMLSAVQSALFNRYVEHRIRNGLSRTAVLGDVLQKLESGGLFLCTDSQADTFRILSGEVVPTGPIFGRKDRWTKGPIRTLELEVWEESGLPEDVFESWGKMALGTRRAIRVFPSDLNATIEPEGLRLSFGLPAGSYATIVAREFFRPTPKPDEGEIEARSEGC